MIPFKAFGKAASYIHQYIKRGDSLTVQGELRISDSYEKDGKTIYGTPYLHIDIGGISCFGGNNNENSNTNDNHTAETTNSAASTSRNNPLLNRTRRRSVL